MTERQFQAAVIQLAEFCGWRVYHVQNVKGQLRNSTAVGFPDLCMARGGLVIFAELKVGDNQPTAEQQAWAKEIGFWAQTSDLWEEALRHYVWRPEHWDEIENVLKSA